VSEKNVESLESFEDVSDVSLTLTRDVRVETFERDRNRVLELQPETSRHFSSEEFSSRNGGKSSLTVAVKVPRRPSGRVISSIYSAE
jgi:hypothetical protein